MTRRFVSFIFAAVFVIPLSRWKNVFAEVCSFKRIRRVAAMYVTLLCLLKQGMA